MRFERKMVMEPRPHCFCCKLPLDISRNDTKHNLVYFDKHFYHKDCFVKLKVKEVKKRCYYCNNDINVECFNENVLYYKNHYYHKNCFEKWCKDTKCRSSVRMTALENIDLYIKAANDNISELSKQKEKQLKFITELENDATIKIKQWFDESDLCSFIREVYGIKIVPWRVLSKILDGTHPKINDPIPAEDLLDMWIRKLDYLKKQNIRLKAQSPKPVETANLINYDLAILTNKYDSYLKWKQEQKILEIETNEKENNLLVRDMVNLSPLANNDQQKSKKEKDDISNLVDDIFG